VLAQIASSLLGVVSQRLLPAASGSGRVAAVEVLLANSAVRNLIREKKIHQIPSVMQTSTTVGMQTMDDSLLQLVRDNKITRQIAIKYAKEPERFLPKFNNEAKKRFVKKEPV
jgi:twitching motility protein PilT